MIPTFLLRKLYVKHSLQVPAEGEIAFALQNPLATVTITAPPKITVNGALKSPKTARVDLEHISAKAPFVFAKGDRLELHLPGRLLRGGNRIHIEVTTAEFGELDWMIEDRRILDEEE